ncbi:MAG: hypothetical protein IKD50_00880, partial [Clostridia bacterium]|nr:hypothetical protein [Clostridia bacterium]
QDDDRNSVPDQPFGEAFHILYLPTCFMLPNMVLTFSTMRIIITIVIDFNNQIDNQSFVNKQFGTIVGLNRHRSLKLLRKKVLTHGSVQ